jgi:hypothetical protein
VSDEVNVAMSISFDGEGFLRRECPTCEREFKWLPSDGDEDAATPDAAGYYCPYCAVQAQDGWLTKAQVEAAHATVMKEIVDPMLGDFTRSLQRSGSGMIKVSGKHTPSPEPPDLSEPDDMRRVDFSCHPSEPLKVLDDWAAPVHCLICGTPAPV